MEAKEEAVLECSVEVRQEELLEASLEELLALPWQPAKSWEEVAYSEEELLKE